MRNLYIIEGPDGAGKSTLVDALASTLPRIPFIIHASGDAELWPTMNAYHESILDIAEQNLANDQVVILDRHWPSEVVYYDVLRPNLGRAYDHILMKARIDGLGGLYVCCVPTASGTKYAAENEPVITVSQHKLICERYMKLFEGLQLAGPNHVFYNREHWDGQAHRAAQMIITYNQHRP